MARAKAATSSEGTTKPALKMPKRAESEAIIRRFLKEDQTIYWAREVPTFYRLYKRYPSLAFWQAHELPFKLNMMTWFEGPEGQEDLSRAWLLFHYVPAAPESLAHNGASSDCQISIDGAPQAGYTEGIGDTLSEHPKLPPRRPRTIAELLRSA